MRHQKKKKKSLYFPEYVQQRESCLYPALWEDKNAAHEACPPTVAEARKPRDPHRITCKGGRAQTSGGHRILHLLSDIQDPTQAAKSCTCSASSDPWKGLRITALLSCSLASPGTMHLRQPLGDLEEQTRRASEVLTHGQLPRTSFIDAMFRILKFFLIGYSCSLISFKSGIWLQFKSFSQDS